MGKRAKKYCSNDDSLISQLPDEILIMILSLLTVKEAGCTMVLSARWIDLWKHLSRLDFEYPAALDRTRQCEGFYHEMKVERHNYVKWLHRILQSNKAPVIKEFNVRFFFGKQHASSINKWLKYAFSHHVERLELNLLPIYDVYYEPHCIFPKQLLNTMKPTFDFKPFKVMYLKAVDVSAEDLGFFLDNCPFLEKMVVWYSNSLFNLEISGFSLKLKHLEICYCYEFTCLTVRDSNLVSLSFAHYNFNIRRPLLGARDLHREKPLLFLENLPSLVDVSICPISIRDVLSVLSCCLLQLVALNVNMRLGEQEEMTELPKLSKFPKLKKLVLSISECPTDTNDCIYECLRVAAPCLQEFVLELHWDMCPKPWAISPEPARFPGTRKEGKSAERIPLQFLKVIKICGFIGCQSELEFIRYIMDYTIALERIIIEPFALLRNPLKVAEHQKHLRDLTKKLEGEVPQHIQLIIL